MAAVNALAGLLESGGIKNVYLWINPLVDSNAMNEKFSIIIGGKKFLSLWLIESAGSDESNFSLAKNICKEEIKIYGYFGINNTNNSFDIFSSLIEEINVLLNGNISSSAELTRIERIVKSSITKKIFSGIMCHYSEISVKLITFRNKQE